MPVNPATLVDERTGLSARELELLDTFRGERSGSVYRDLIGGTFINPDASRPGQTFSVNWEEAVEQLEQDRVQRVLNEAPRPQHVERAAIRQEEAHLRGEPRTVRLGDNSALWEEIARRDRDRSHGEAVHGQANRPVNGGVSASQPRVPPRAPERRMEDSSMSPHDRVSATIDNLRNALDGTNDELAILDALMSTLHILKDHFEAHP